MEESGESADGPRPAKRARLTRMNLAQLDRMTNGNSATHNTQNAAGNEEESAPSRPPTASRGTRSSYSSLPSKFAVQAAINGVLGPEKSKPPTNLEEIHAMLAKPRASPPPSVAEYEEYVSNVSAASNKQTLVVDMSRDLLKRHGHGYVHSYNQSFSAFPPDVGFNNGFSVPPKPGYVEGLAMQEFWPFLVDEHVDGAVLYDDNPQSVTLAHLAGEWAFSLSENKEDDITQRAVLKSAHAGAALVYAHDRALDFLGTTEGDTEKDKPGHTAITTFTTDGNTLTLYAHYALLTETSDTDFDDLLYHQYPIGSTSLVNSYAEYETGRQWLRNVQEYAKDQSYALRDELKTRWRAHRDAVKVSKDTT